MDKVIIKDLLETVKRLNKELDSRVEFEHKLIEHINRLELAVVNLRQENSKLSTEKVNTIFPTKDITIVPESEVPPFLKETKE